jgi:ATP-dependent exoDNAse (exonuclease V) beta subunit
MNQELRKGVSAALVFAEVMGVIKGSVEALVSPAGHLSEQAYLALAQQRTSSLTVLQRQQVYSLYLQYERYKRQAWQYDHMDRVLYVYRQLAAADAAGEPLVDRCQEVDRVYVDEVQDLSMAQLYLLR